MITDRNPIENLKVLYGTGALKLNDRTGKPEQVGGVKWTIKDGILYDAKALLMFALVAQEKQAKRLPKRTGNPKQELRTAGNPSTKSEMKPN
jgi:hypothetical protein